MATLTITTAFPPEKGYPLHEGGEYPLHAKWKHLAAERQL